MRRLGWLGAKRKPRVPLEFFFSIMKSTDVIIREGRGQSGAESHDQSRAGTQHVSLIWWCRSREFRDGTRIKHLTSNRPIGRHVGYQILLESTLCFYLFDFVSIYNINIIISVSLGLAHTRFANDLLMKKNYYYI